MESKVIGFPGTYGFALYPALLCEGDTDIDRIRYVSKVFYGENQDLINESYKKEVKDLEFINKIDKKHTFTLHKLSNCIKPVDIINQIKNISNFGQLTNVFNNLHINRVSNLPVINIEYGGTDFETILKDSTFSIQLSELVKLLKPVFSGLHRLNNREHYVHRDIKPANVLFNLDKISVIDFGLACHSNKVFDNDISSLSKLEKIYAFYPPEFQIIGYLYRNKDTVDLNNRKIIKSVAIKNIYKPYLSVNQGNLFENGNDFINFKNIDSFLDRLKDANYVEFMHDNKLDSKCDIYGIGYILFLLYSKSKIIFDSSDHKKQFLNIVIQMLAVNPFDRISFKDAYKLLNQISKNKDLDIISSLKSMTITSIPSSSNKLHKKQRIIGGLKK